MANTFKYNLAFYNMATIFNYNLTLKYAILKYGRQRSIFKIIHSLVFSLSVRVGRIQIPVMWPVWLWHT